VYCDFVLYARIFNILMFRVQSSIQLLYTINHFYFHRSI